MTTNRARLTQPEFFTLAKFVEGNRDIFAGKWAADMVPLCVSHMGRPIDRDTISRAADTVGVVMRKRPVGPPKPAPKAKLQAPPCAGERILARELAVLMRILGEHPSADLLSLAREWEST